MNTHEKGKIGESRAAAYLADLGYSILEMNYRIKGGEIDIIATAPDGTLVFAEVKSANTTTFGNPLHKITPTKQRTIISTAKRYMYRHKITKRPYRFDIIGIYKDKLEHLKNAFWTNY